MIGIKQTEKIIYFVKNVNPISVPMGTFFDYFLGFDYNGSVFNI